MRGVAIGGAVTLVAGAVGWISYGHLVVFLGLEVLTSLWFSRLRTRESTGPVTNKYAKPHTYVTKVDGREEVRHFRPVLGKPLTTQDRHLLAYNGTAVLGAAALMAIMLGVLLDPSVFTPVQLLSMSVLTGFMVADEVRFHALWSRLGLARRADPTLQMLDEYWRVLLFICLGALLAILDGVPRLQTCLFAALLLGTDLLLHGRREKWAGLPSGDLPPAAGSVAGGHPRPGLGEVEVPPGQ